MRRAENDWSRTASPARRAFRLLCALMSAVVMQSSFVTGCLANNASDAASGPVSQVDFWTNVPEQWDCFENNGLMRVRTKWKLSPQSREIIATYRALIPTRIKVALESFDGNHVVFAARYGGYRGTYEGNLNGKSIDGTVCWNSAFGRRKQKWHAQWSGSENWPAPKTPADRQAAKDGPAQQLSGQVQIADEAKSSPAVTVKHLPPRIRRRDEDARLTIAYPEHYPFPLVSIQFPSDYSDTFVDEIAGFKCFQKEKKEILAELVNEQVVKGLSKNGSSIETLS